jgi:putative ABC transport system substrate-binding protein
VKRRDFIRLLGGAAAWPLTARAQQQERMRRLAILMGSTETAVDQKNVAALLARLKALGWERGHNISADVRWWEGDAKQMQFVVRDMLAQTPDVIIAFTNLALAVLKPISGDVPVVFVGVGDPVGSGFVASLARPGGTITGFASNEAPMGGKWLEVLKETAPHVTRILALLHPETPIHQAFLRSIENAAPHFGVEVVPGAVHDAAEIDHAISSFAVEKNSGLIVLPHSLSNANRDLIVALTLQHRLPAIGASSLISKAGLLVSYGVDFEDSFRRTAEYVHRILRGEKPADLPVQEPLLFKLVFNLNTARMIGLEIAPVLLARADEVIE